LPCLFAPACAPACCVIAIRFLRSVAAAAVRLRSGRP
jgi:hypothetical protein